MVEQVRDLVRADALAGQNVDGLGEIVAELGRSALPVLGEIGEHREKHEAADEIERLVLGQRAEPGIDGLVGDDSAVAVDGRGPDIFDPPEQSVAAEAADDVAEDSAEETDVGVLLDRVRLRGRLSRPHFGFDERLGHGARLLPRSQK